MAFNSMEELADVYEKIEQGKATEQEKKSFELYLKKSSFKESAIIYEIKLFLAKR